jgi:hypothetical protein
MMARPITMMGRRTIARLTIAVILFPYSIGFFNDVKLFFGPLGFELFGLDILVVGLGFEEHLVEGSFECTLRVDCQVD